MNEPPEPEVLEPAPAAPEPISAPPVFPWPPAGAAGPFTAFVDTWRGATFHPRAFFATMPAGETGAAVLYYLVVGILVAGLQLFWDAVLPTSASVVGLPYPTSGLSPLIGFLLSPIYLLASLLLAAGATHVVALVLVRDSRDFSTTLRVFCYAYSPLLFAVVPRIGQLVGFVWMIVIAIIGIREAHRTTDGRAATVVLVPLLLAIALATLAALLLIASGLLLIP